MRSTRRRVAGAQAAYFAGTGLLPFVSRRAFEAVTGPKKEWWLVETVGLVVTAIGAGLAVAARRDAVSPEVMTVAVGSAAGLAAIDVVYVAAGRIRWTYLLDAAVEVGLLAAWAATAGAERAAMSE